MLRSLGVKTIFSDALDRAACLRAGDRLSPTVPWEVNREIFGAVQLCRSRVDGVILMTAFPCPAGFHDQRHAGAPGQGCADFNDYPGQPVRSAGLETRLESFVDILRFRRASADKKEA